MSAEAFIRVVIDEAEARDGYDEFVADYRWYEQNDPKNNYPEPPRTFGDYCTELVDGYADELVANGLPGASVRIERVTMPVATEQVK